MSTATISIADVAQRCRSGERMNIIDVRTPAEFARVHAVGAVLVPLDELDPGALGALRKSPDEPIYVICQSGGRATKACQRLAEAGMGPALCVDGGTAAWERAGLPVERGTGRVISLERQVRIGAGSLVLIGLLLAWLVHPVFLGLTGFIGGGLIFAGVTDFCGMAMLLAKMPWNRTAGSASGACAPAKV